MHLKGGVKRACIWKVVLKIDYFTDISLLCQLNDFCCGLKHRLTSRTRPIKAQHELSVQRGCTHWYPKRGPRISPEKLANNNCVYCSPNVLFTYCFYLHGTNFFKNRNDTIIVNKGFQGPNAFRQGGSDAIERYYSYYHSSGSWGHGTVLFSIQYIHTLPMSVVWNFI